MKLTESNLPKVKYAVKYYVISTSYSDFEADLSTADCSRPIGQLESADWSTTVG